MVTNHPLSKQLQAFHAKAWANGTRMEQLYKELETNRDFTASMSRSMAAQSAEARLIEGLSRAVDRALRREFGGEEEKDQVKLAALKAAYAAVRREAPGLIRNYLAASRSGWSWTEEMRQVDRGASWARDYYADE